MIAQADPQAARHLLSFTVADLRCAVGVDDVREVLPAARLEPVPGAPPAAMGVLDVRSELVVVLDGHRCLGMDAPPLRVADRFVVLETPGWRRALRVDGVDDVVRVDERDVAALPSGSAGDDTSVAGLVRLDDGLLMIHDPARFLSTEHATAVERAIAELVASR